MSPKVEVGRNEAHKLVSFVLSDNLKSGYQNIKTARRTGRSPIMQHPHIPPCNISGIIYVRTVNTRPLIVEAVAHEALGEDNQGGIAQSS
jgi:hypothetical protein